MNLHVLALVAITHVYADDLTVEPTSFTTDEDIPQFPHLMMMMAGGNDPRVTTVKVPEFRVLLGRRYALFAAAAYCLRKATLGNWSCPQHHLRGLAGQVRVEAVFEPFRTAARGYIALSPSPSSDLSEDPTLELIVAFRGTLKLQNALNDLNLLPGKYPEHVGMVHSGFYATANSVFSSHVLPVVMRLLKQHNRKIGKIIVTGHSLGGAVAILTAKRLLTALPNPPAIECWTFGEPRVGDKDFSLDVSTSLGLTVYRIMRVADWVPEVPMEAFGYRHHGNNVWYVDKETWECVSPQDPSIAWSLGPTGGVLRNPVRHLKIWDVVFGPWCFIPSIY